MAEIMVAPSILSGDFADMAKSVADLEKWGGDYVHCDVMDGVYVPNITFGMPMIAALRKRTEKPLDVHLMITKPEKYVERFAASGADFITFHPDASSDPLSCIEIIHKAGKKAGIVFNPNVPIEPYIELFEKCDMILVMTVYAGYGGQKLIPECVDRIRLIHSILQEKNLSIPIEVDGGVTVETAPSVKEAGATVLVAGSAVFKAENPSAVIAKLKESTK